MRKFVLLVFLLIIGFSFIPAEIQWNKILNLKNPMCLTEFVSSTPFDFPQQWRKTKKDWDEWLRIREKFGTKNQEINPEWAWIIDGGGGVNDNLYGAYNTPDGGYFINAYTPQMGNLIWSCKLSKNGVVEWAHRDSTSEDSGRGGTELHCDTRDGGYVGVGRCSTEGAQICVAKFSSNDELEWTRALGGLWAEVGFSIQQTKDGGYIVAGYTYSFLHPEELEYARIYNDIWDNIWIAKLSPTGDIEWQYAYGGLGFEAHFGGFLSRATILESPNGGYLLACGSDSFNDVEYRGWPDIWLVKLDSKGQIEWQKTYGGRETEFFPPFGPHLQVTDDGGYIFAAYTLSFGVVNPETKSRYPDIWVVKISATGNIEWQKTYGGISTEIVRVILVANGGGYIVGGTTNSFGNGLQDFWLVKLNEQGSIEWQKTYGGEFGDDAFYVQQARDGGYFLAGTTYSFSENEDILLLKVSPEGAFSPGCGLVLDSGALVLDTHVVPQDTYVTPLIANGGSYEIYPTYANIEIHKETICWNLNQSPINLSFEKVENRSFFASEVWHTITWSPNPYNSQFSIAEYKIYRKEAEYETFSYQPIGTVPANMNIFVDSKETTGMNENARYLYVVTSVDYEGNESPKSEPVGYLN